MVFGRLSVERLVLYSSVVGFMNFLRVSVGQALALTGVLNVQRLVALIHQRQQLVLVVASHGRAVRVLVVGLSCFLVTTG